MICIVDLEQNFLTGGKRYVHFRMVRRLATTREWKQVMFCE